MCKSREAGLGQVVGKESIQYGEWLPGWGRGGQDVRLEGQTGLSMRTAVLTNLDGNLKATGSP